MAEDKSLEQMEKEAAASENHDAPAPVTSENPWAGEERKKDEHSNRDAEPRVKIYTLSVPNKMVKDGYPNPGFRKLCLDRDFTIAPRDIIRCVVLHRVYQRVAQLPYKQKEKIPKDEPWKGYLGFSLNSDGPTPDSQGWYFPKCKSEDGSPWKMCSFPTTFKDGEVVEVPLKDGECPWGRWGNSISEADREKYKLTKESKPLCNNQIVLYCYDLDLMVPFVAYFKVTSYQSAVDFIAGCSRREGDNITEYPFHAFEAQIIVKGEDEYCTSHIQNTGKFTEPAKIKPLVKWFEANSGIIIRNLAIQMEEAKKRKAKKDEATDFNPEDYES